MTTPVSLDTALAAVRNVSDGPRLLEQANRIADTLEAENTELRRRITTAAVWVRVAPCYCGHGVCERCQALGILGGGT